MIIIQQENLKQSTKDNIKSNDIVRWPLGKKSPRIFITAQRTHLAFI